jgi:hypothetical protein
MARTLATRFSIACIVVGGLAVGMLFAAATASANHSHVATVAVTRAFIDRPDQVTGPQIHLIYAVPSNGVDRRLDVNDDIAQSFGVAEQWLVGQTGGARFRLDTYHRAPDITFVRLPETNAQIASHGVYSRDQIEALVRALGFRAANKIYEVFYDGSSSVCGSAPWPSALLGHVPVIYLKGTPPNAPGCDTQPFAKLGQPSGYLEMDELHEIVHTLGFVPSCAPHSNQDSHVTDSNTDLMYAGPLPWDTSQMVLDYNHDDYFNANIPGCLDLSNSAFLTDGGSQMPPGFNRIPPTLPAVCVVPRLVGLSSGRARAALSRAACRVGRVRASGARSRRRVIMQSAPARSVHAAGYRVNLRLAGRA